MIILNIFTLREVTKVKERRFGTRIILQSTENSENQPAIFYRAPRNAKTHTSHHRSFKDNRYLKPRLGRTVQVYPRGAKLIMSQRKAQRMR